MMPQSAGLAVLVALAAAIVGCGATIDAQTASPVTTVSTASAPPSTGPSATVDAAPVAATEEAAPRAPVEVTGRIVCGRSVRAESSTTLELADAAMTVSRNRDAAWRQSVTMSDPRLEGVIHNTWEVDRYRAAGEEGPFVAANTWRIENADGAWEHRGYEGTFPDGTPIGAPIAVFVGSGAYEGLVAVMAVTADPGGACAVDVRGVRFDGAPLPEPFIPE